MKCVNCDSNNWMSVDEMRIKPSGMSICKECGFVSYPEKWKSEEEIKKFYKADYRKVPTVGNYHTGQKKLSYHEAFLREYLPMWAAKDKVVMCDIGAAFGMFPAWFKNYVPNAEIHGTEWDQAYQRNAFEEYNLVMTDEIDTSKKYDFISLYNVAEHMLDIDVKLKQYFELLNDDGLLYIAVPQWFGQFYNPGPGSCDIEYYYHADHVNVWTREIFESILAKCGFEIVKSNFTMYNPKYICKKMAVKTEWTPFKHDYLEIKTRMLQTRKCFDAFMCKDFKGAIDAYPNCSMAWRGLYESARKQYHDEGIESLEGLMKAAINACPESTEVIIFTADLYQRYEHFERALECWNMALRMRPNSPVCLGNIAHCLRGIYRKTGEQKYLIEARDISRHIAKISLENLPEMLTWIYNDNSKIVRE